MPGLHDSASAPAYSGAAFLHHNPFDRLRLALDRPLRYLARGLTANAAIQEDKGIAEGVNTFNGVLTYGAVAAAQKREWQPVGKLV